MTLIDKDALIAEIERQIELGKFKCQQSQKNNDYESYVAWSEHIATCGKILSFINTLEVKEVDLDDYYHKFLEKEWFGKHCNRTISEMMAFTAKHFFELGLNMQQNISINVTDIDKVIEENGVDPNSKEAKMFKESYYMALEKLKTTKGE